MINNHIISQELEKVKLEDLDRDKVIGSLSVQQNIIKENFNEIMKNGSELLKIKDKGTLLLEFRRYIERLLRTDLILVVENVYDKKLTAIKPENVIFHLDRRYYSDFKLCPFVDIFKIETNDYKRINWVSNLPPHVRTNIKLCPK